MQNQQRKDLNKLVSHLIQQMGNCFTNLNELTQKIADLNQKIASLSHLDMGKANSYRQQQQLFERQYQSIEQQYHLYEQIGAHFFAISGSKFSSETMHAFDSLCDRLTNEYRLSPNFTNGRDHHRNESLHRLCSRLISKKIAAIVS